MHSDYEGPLDVAVRHSLAFLGEVHQRPVGPFSQEAALRDMLDRPLRDQPADPVEVVSELALFADLGLLAGQSPRFFGFVNGGSSPAALAADWLTSAWDQNAGMYAVSPAAAVAERTVAGWLLDLFGLPVDSSVGLVTGGQMATWTCLAAARHHLLAAEGWDVERMGLQRAPKITVVAGAERHGTVDRALRFLGLGTDVIQPVAVDREGRMLAEDLALVLGRLDGPLIVVAEAGNVNTGAFDPIRDIIPLARESRAWVHVDGAFGLWAQASSRHRHLTEGLAGADSWSVDAHKWLNVPYDSGIAITRHSAAHRAALGYTAAYLADNADPRLDALNWNPEHSRRARAFPIWAALRTLGRRGVEDLVDRLCDRAVQFASALEKVDGIEVLNDVVLNQVLVRFTNDSDPDGHTRSVIARVQDEGTCWMSGTTWDGEAAMRISVSNWATTPEDVERSVAAILRCSGLDVDGDDSQGGRPNGTLR